MYVGAILRRKSQFIKGKEPQVSLIPRNFKIKQMEEKERKREDDLQGPDQISKRSHCEEDPEIANELLGWNSLPTEITQFILLQITITHTRQQEVNTSNGPAAEELKANLMVCRFVCRQWRDILPVPWFRCNTKGLQFRLDSGESRVSWPFSMGKSKRLFLGLQHLR